MYFQTLQKIAKSKCQKWVDFHGLKLVKFLQAMNFRPSTRTIFESKFSYQKIFLLHPTPQISESFSSILFEQTKPNINAGLKCIKSFFKFLLFADTLT